jgi:hypothetical protein
MRVIFFLDISRFVGRHPDLPICLSEISSFKDESSMGVLVEWYWQAETELETHVEVFLSKPLRYPKDHYFVHGSQSSPVRHSRDNSINTKHGILAE